MNKLLPLSLILLLPTSVMAVPTLQVGAVNSTYLSSSSNPTESDTAITTDYKLLVGGVYRNGVVALGGGSWGEIQWSSGQFFPSEFEGSGAVLVASVPKGYSGELTVDGSDPFTTSDVAYFPNNHDPLNDTISEYLYFDIGEFNNDGVVGNFTGESGSGIGEVKELLISVTGFPWVHFDVLALQTVNTKRGLLGSLVNNPGSHDVTWFTSDVNRHGIPSPSTHLLLGLGLVMISLGSGLRKIKPLSSYRKG